MKSKERWKEEPDPHDYPAAAEYLGLLLDEIETAAVVEALKAAPITRRLAKDLLRSSRLALLARDDFHVALDLAKVKRGEHLSPVLVLRGRLRDDVPLTVADGYHRICASYHLDENAPIPCRLADLSAAKATEYKTGAARTKRPERASGRRLVPQVWASHGTPTGSPSFAAYGDTERIEEDDKDVAYSALIFRARSPR